MLQPNSITAPCLQGFGPLGTSPNAEVVDLAVKIQEPVAAIAASGGMSSENSDRTQ